MADKAPTVQELRIAVSEIDSLSRTSFQKIAGITSLALKSLEDPKTYTIGGMTALTGALMAIYDEVTATSGSIDYLSEQVGCNDRSLTEQFLRQWRALQAAEAVRHG